MGWFVRNGRLLLAVVAGLLTVFLIAQTLRFYDRTAPALPLAGPAYPRIQQAAGIIDLMRDLDPKLRPAVLRAVDGLDLRVVITPQGPTDVSRLKRAPRIEEKLREFAAPGIDGSLRAYTQALVPQRTTDTEGWPALITWQISDGQTARMTFVERHRPMFNRQTIPDGFLVGLAGLAVAALALALGQRSTRLLHRVAAAADSFDGTIPGAIPASNVSPDLQRLATAVETMQRRVATLLQERSFLIGAISHDLKTYLTRVRLRAESIADADGRDRMTADLEAMTDLIDTSLAFARGTTVREHRSLIDLADLAAVEAAERLAVGQQVTTCDRAGDAQVLGDPVALRRVLTNLVDNALKYGRGRVEIGVADCEQGYALVVDDDGPGIGEVERSAIFSPFYRIERSRNRRTGGSGLGLAIARQIVEAHGGTIVVSDSPFKGARLVVRLPKADLA